MSVVMDTCATWQMHKQPFSRSTYTANNVNELIFSYLVGPLQVESVGGARYYVLIKDVYSNYKFVYFMARKSETADCILEYAKKIKTQTGNRVQTLGRDGVTVYLNYFIEIALADLKINLQISVPHNPKQNGITERDHRSTVQSAGSLTLTSNSFQQCFFLI
jgi:transposase InsO family protein